MLRIVFTCCFLLLSVQAAAEDGMELKALPEAMAHRAKAPPVDIAKLRDPFASFLLMLAREQAAEKKARQRTRPLDPLEAFDLSVLKLVAILKFGDQRVAMVEDSEGKGYMVKVGHHMGKHEGEVVAITDDSLILKERVFNPAGEMVTRTVVMSLREVKP